jgi:hypothetical protein
VGAPPAKLVNDFLQALAERNIDYALEAVGLAVKGGSDARMFTLLAITKVRGVLLMRFSPKGAKELEEQFGEDDAVFLKQLAGKEGVNINSNVLAELITAYLESARAPIPELPLELALYRLSE